MATLEATGLCLSATIGQPHQEGMGPEPGTGDVSGAKVTKEDRDGTAGQL